MTCKMKAVDGWPGYFVSRSGNLYTTKSNSGKADKPIRKMFPALRDGYPRVRLSYRGKQRNVGVHTLVLETFIGRKPPRKVARHLNGRRVDNRVKNLRWGTSSKNRMDMWRHGTMPHGSGLHSSKLTERIVTTLRKAYATGRVTQANLAKRYGVDEKTVSSAITGALWKHVKAATVSGNNKRRGIRHHAAVLNDSLVRRIRREYRRHGSPDKIAKDLSVGVGAVSGVLRKKTWRHVK